jgi:hypothetical protein
MRAPDANDILRRNGADALRDAIDNSAESDWLGDGTNGRFKLELLDDIAIGDDPVELVRGILPMGPALAVIHGPPKSLKSYLLIHISIHIAADIPFCGVRRRLIAARRALEVEGKRVPFFLVPAMPNLGAGPEDRAEIQQQISEAIRGLGIPVRLVVIDTMRRAMPGKSENDQKDVSVVIDNCESLARAFDCLVALVHHSPRSDDDRGSGSNAVDAAADAIIGCKRDQTSKIATASVLRLKDGEEGDSWSFGLRPLVIGIERQGRPIESCYVEVTTAPERRPTAAKSAKLTEAQQRVYNILVGAVAEAGDVGRGAAWPARHYPPDPNEIS